MCASEPQIAVVVTLMIASRGLRIVGSGTVSTRIFSLPSQQTARIGRSLCGGERSRRFASLELTLEAPQIFADRLRRLGTKEPRERRAGLAADWLVLQVHADLRFAAASYRV